MKLEKIINEIQKIFPLKTAEEFDNVGLLIGKADVECNKALVCHDVTNETIDEALNNKCQLIISYHPLIFNSLKKINYKDRIGRIITKMIENKLSLYSIHTSFDNLKNEALNGNRTKTNNLINETVLESNKNIFYLNAINQRLAKLLEIIQKTRNSNYEDTINLMKPPIFWKEKPKFIEQLKNWNIIKIKRALNLSYDTEIKLKSNSLIDHDLLIKKLIIDVCIIANS